MPGKQRLNILLPSPLSPHSQVFCQRQTDLFQWAEAVTASVRMLRDAGVTVRSRPPKQKREEKQPRYKQNLFSSTLSPRSPTPSEPKAAVFSWLRGFFLGKDRSCPVVSDLDQWNICEKDVSAWLKDPRILRKWTKRHLPGGRTDDLFSRQRAMCQHTGTVAPTDPLLQLRKTTKEGNRKRREHRRTDRETKGGHEKKHEKRKEKEQVTERVERSLRPNSASAPVVPSRRRDPPFLVTPRALFSKAKKKRRSNFPEHENAEETTRFEKKRKKEEQGGEGREGRAERAGGDAFPTRKQRRRENNMTDTTKGPLNERKTADGTIRVLSVAPSHGLGMDQNTGDTPPRRAQRPRNGCSPCDPSQPQEILYRNGGDGDIYLGTIREEKAGIVGNSRKQSEKPSVPLVDLKCLVGQFCEQCLLFCSCALTTPPEEEDGTSLFAVSQKAFLAHRVLFVGSRRRTVGDTTFSALLFFLPFVAVHEHVLSASPPPLLSSPFSQGPRPFSRNEEDLLEHRPPPSSVVLPIPELQEHTPSSSLASPPFPSSQFLKGPKGEGDGHPWVPPSSFPRPPDPAPPSIRETPGDVVSQRAVTLITQELLPLYGGCFLSEEDGTQWLRSPPCSTSRLVSPAIGGRGVVFPPPFFFFRGFRRFSHGPYAQTRRRGVYLGKIFLRECGKTKKKKKKKKKKKEKKKRDLSAVVEQTGNVWMELMDGTNEW
eukprot:CAMPEP_0113900238 /NCGR_PEP_ID=MMETSP0780_2-20120614/20548_1 /TAXON_ID=652834 /ORGANISM="Palpitomonas bilix" /LENGTH=710 /DNA_ID=CAMNT_0000892639 /DNA_START=727 /DNA_END=2857 /DNA_ORIENTATION=+ /assembly_acc=CAM_ASM_000599